MNVAKKINPEFSSQGKKIFPFIFYLCEMMDTHWTYCGNLFMMYVGQIITLYTLNLHTTVCQLYLNKIGREKKLKYNTASPPFPFKPLRASPLELISPSP